jgi:hypothetical protein
MSDKNNEDLPPPPPPMEEIEEVSSNEDLPPPPLIETLKTTKNKITFKGEEKGKEEEETIEENNKKENVDLQSLIESVKLKKTVIIEKKEIVKKESMMDNILNRRKEIKEGTFKVPKPKESTEEKNIIFSTKQLQKVTKEPTEKLNKKEFCLKWNLNFLSNNAPLVYVLLDEKSYTITIKGTYSGKELTTFFNKIVEEGKGYNIWNKSKKCNEQSEMISFLINDNAESFKENPFLLLGTNEEIKSFSYINWSKGLIEMLITKNYKYIKEKSRIHQERSILLLNGLLRSIEKKESKSIFKSNNEKEKSIFRYAIEEKYVEIVNEMTKYMILNYEKKEVITIMTEEYKKESNILKICLDYNFEVLDLMKDILKEDGKIKKYLKIKKRNKIYKRRRRD